MNDFEAVIYKRRKSATAITWLVFGLILFSALAGVGTAVYSGMMGDAELLNQFEVYAANLAVYFWLAPAGLMGLIIFLLVAYSLGTRKTLTINGDILRFDNYEIDLRSADIRMGKWNIKYAGAVGSIFYLNNGSGPISIACFGVNHDSDKYNINPDSVFDYGLNDPNKSKELADLILAKMKTGRDPIRERVFDLQGARNGLQTLVIMVIFYLGAGLLSLLGYFVFNSGLDERTAVPIFMGSIYGFIFLIVIIGSFITKRKGARLKIGETELTISDLKSGQEKNRIPIGAIEKLACDWKVVKRHGPAIVLNLEGKTVAIGCRDAGLSWTASEGNVHFPKYEIESDEFKEIAKEMNMANQITNLAENK
ncbi:MAG: hypothetical protein ACOYUZ_04420 [Patescibacteria group bacterium]